MNQSLAGKTAVITGASTGLGKHFAQVLSTAGATVILCARRGATLEAVARRVVDSGGRASIVTLDVSSATSIAAFASAVESVDILVNNAGIARSAPALEVNEEDWDAVLNTNLKGAFFVAQTVANAMKAHGRGGSIINTASIMGIRQSAGVLPYAVSKAGVIQMTKTLALELARFAIRVNAIAPGYLKTDINNSFLESEPGLAAIRRIPMRRAGNLNDLDGPLLLLASDQGAYITGSVITVDGGHLVSGL